MRGLSNSSWQSNTVNAFGKLTTEHYLASGTSSKRILRRRDDSLGILAKVEMCVKW